MNRYQLAVDEVRSVLAEWIQDPVHDILAATIVDRLVAHGVIQSTDPNDLVDEPLEPVEPVWRP